MKVYIAGPMSGVPDLNYPAFFAAEADWRREGWDVANPARNFPADPTLTRAECMRKDLADILICDAMAFLPGWERSIGASFERSVAAILEMPVYDALTFGKLTGESVCEEAQRLVGGDRGASYGHPLDDYTRTAAMWSAILGHTVTAEQAIACMIAVKLSRETHKPKRDNRTDMAGYAQCLDMVHAERERRKSA